MADGVLASLRLGVKFTVFAASDPSLIGRAEVLLCRNLPAALQRRPTVAPSATFLLH